MSDDAAKIDVATTDAAPGLTPAGVVVAAHGVKGLLRVKTFTETPAALDAYGPLADSAGAPVYDLQVVEARDAVAIVRMKGVDGRTQAERFKGAMLYLKRDALPEPEADEFFHADLIGLAAATAADGRIGEVAALNDYGAGDLIEIALDAGGPPLVLPFTLAVVPEIDLVAGTVLLAPPAGLWPREQSAAERRRAERAAAEDPAGNAR